MPQYVTRGNLNAARFPLVSTFSGRTIIVPQYDQNFQKLANFSGGDTDRDIGIPQVFYGHNVVPTSEGMQSVAYTQAIAPADPEQDDFNEAFIIRDMDENKGIFVPAGGKNYMFNGNINAWQSVNPLPPGTVPSDVLVTVANLHGHTYQFYSNVGPYEYDFTSNTLAPVVFSGLTVSNLLGICAAVTYMVTWDATNTVFWSSTIDGTDFVPSLSTGAGSEIPNDIKGDIVVILPISNGFVIYTTRNAVLASYTGNIRFPWVFKEIPGSAGVQSPEHVTWEANTGFHYAWTTSGLLKVERTGAEPLEPEITDFLTARIFEDYDEVSGLLVQEFIGVDLSVKLTLLQTRFLIISYGKTAGIFTHALFFDASIKRFGKLKITHTDCFDWPTPNLFGIQSYADLSPRTYADLAGTSYAELSTQQITFSKPKRSIAFLQSDGTVQILNFDLADNTASGVLFLGKYQLVRVRKITFLNLDVENVNEDNVSDFSVVIFASYDGKNFARSLIPMQVYKSTNIIKYGGRLTGENFAVAILGAFNLVTTVLSFTNSGDR